MTEPKSVVLPITPRGSFTQSSSSSNRAEEDLLGGDGVARLSSCSGLGEAGVERLGGPVAAGCGAAPAELFSQGTVIVLAGNGKHPEAGFRFFNSNPISRQQSPQYSAVDDDAGRLVRFGDGEFQMGIGGVDQRAVGQGVGTDWGDDDRLQVPPQNGTSGGQVVGGGADGGSDDQSVASIACR